MKYKSENIWVCIEIKEFLIFLSIHWNMNVKCRELNFLWLSWCCVVLYKGDENDIKLCGVFLWLHTESYILSFHSQPLFSYSLCYFCWRRAIDRNLIGHQDSLIWNYKHYVICVLELCGTMVRPCSWEIWQILKKKVFMIFFECWNI